MLPRPRLRSVRVSGITKDGGVTLPQKQKDWYLKRSVFWLTVYQSLQQQNSAVENGTYKIPDDFKRAFVDAPLQPKAPTITSKLVEGSTSLTVEVDLTHLSGSAPSRIYVCVWTQKPNDPKAMDCSDPMSVQKPVALSNDKVGSDENKNPYLQATSDNSYTLTLKTPLKNQQYVSIVQRATVGGTDRQISSAAAVAVGPTTQCNKSVSLTPYSDCDTKFSIIGGVERERSKCPAQFDRSLSSSFHARRYEPGWQRSVFHVGFR